MRRRPVSLAGHIRTIDNIDITPDEDVYWNCSIAKEAILRLRGALNRRSCPPRLLQ